MATISPRRGASPSKTGRSFWIILLIAIGMIILGVAFSRVRGDTHGNVPILDTPIRVFSSWENKLGQDENDPTLPSLPSSRVLQGEGLSHTLYSRADQRRFLERYGKKCTPGQEQSSTSSSGDMNLVLKRYDALPSPLKTELWKYCMLYTGHGNVWLDVMNLAPLMNVDSLLKPQQNVALAIDGPAQLLHTAFLQLAQDHSMLAHHMISVLLETSNEILEANGMLLPESLAMFVQSDLLGEMVLWRSHCQTVAKDPTVGQVVSSNIKYKNGMSCPIPGGYCCHVTTSTTGNLPVMALKHPVRGGDEAISSSSNESDPYVSKVVEKVLPIIAEKVTSEETPNAFDIFLRNDCLPTQQYCNKCMKVNGNCEACHEECPCYCRALCKIRPPPKQVVKEYHVYPPSFKRDPSRLVPRIIHQTWYEPVTPEKYPNMSRLIESFKQSGWEYTFYDDDTAAEFLSKHFPPEVRQAYDSILPGAFKADLFRYCVLLIKGGVYADMDVLLEANLDEAVASDVGFMTPIDEPGTDVGHRSCLWNGLLAVAPGHPFLAQTIEFVVNNIRNRFTSVDYDDMLCPNPVLSVSHSVDTLFTCGPCILGAAINTVIDRHMQHEFEIGDVDIWNVKGKLDPSVAHSEDDPRFLIPGRTIILSQNKRDMGAHRFTWDERNLMVAATDMPDYDDRPPNVVHYSKTHKKIGIYGLQELYSDDRRANEEIRIIVKNVSSLVQDKTLVKSIV